MVSNISCLVSPTNFVRLMLSKLYFDATLLVSIRKPSFFLSLNFLNFSRNRAREFLKFFSTFTEINWLKWVTFSLFLVYIRI